MKGFSAQELPTGTFVDKLKIDVLGDLAQRMVRTNPLIQIDMRVGKLPLRRFWYPIMGFVSSSLSGV